MNRTISSTYFQKLCSDTDNHLETYAPIGDPLILFSEVDGTALASIHLRPSSRYRAKTDMNARMLIASYSERNDGEIQRYQGLCNMENQEFELVITNLSPKGNINFNLMKTNDAVTETNPCGINEINELREYESYAVQCDQMNNFPLILQKFRNKICC